MSLELPVELDETLDKKFKKILDRPEISDKVIVQNYFDGSVRLIRDSHVNSDTIHRIISGVNDGRRQFNVSPRYRLVPKDEALDLWRAWVYYEYYETMTERLKSQTRDALHEIKKYKDVMGLDDELISTLDERKAMVEARNARNQLSGINQDFKHFNTKFKLMKAWFAGMVVPFRKARDAAEVAERERVIIEQETMREKARLDVRQQFEEKIGMRSEGVRKVTNTDPEGPGLLSSETTSDPAVLVADEGEELSTEDPAKSGKAD